jgi:protein-tyrosine phosphatase
VAPAQRERLALYLPWSGGEGQVAIPDPTGGSDHFEQVWTLVDNAAKRAVARLLHDADSGIIGP